MKIKPNWLDHLHATRRRELELIFRRCPKELFRTALELGAGDCFQSTLLTAYVSKLISTDYDKNILNKKMNEQIKYLHCDARNVASQFQGKHFDLIFSSNMLEHVQNPSEILRGIFSVLKNDGITIHVMPSWFWKFCNLFLYAPSRILSLLEILSQKHSMAILLKKAKNRNLRQDNLTIRRPQRSFIARLFVPDPHGVSNTNLEEFFAFSRLRWKAEFERAGFNLINVVKGPVTSGYGFGLTSVRNLLERIGVTSEYVYIAKKKNSVTRYEQYF